MSRAWSAEPDASILTLSYSGDLDTCRRLCDSVDRFAPAGMSQRLFVPTHDLPLFAPMAHGTRTLGSQDRDLLPRWLWKLPMPSPPLRALLRLPRRNIYLSPFSRPVRGWIAQQIMKIAACAESPTEIIMHVDSDGEFIRPFTANAVLRSDGLARFYRNPEKSNYQTHIAWRETACRLLGVEPDSVFPGDYIDLCIVWRRSIVRRMIERMEQVGGTDWRKIVAREQNFSEYTLYGLFVESLGIEAAGHFNAPDSLCHTLWEDEIRTPEDETAFVEGVKPTHIAFLLQSNLPYGEDMRMRIFDRVAARVAQQDEQPPLPIRAA